MGIAIGTNANAKKDRSLVINLNKKGDEVSSNRKGEFLVNSDSFTLQIKKEFVTIDKKNIQIFKNLLTNSDEGRRNLEQINKDQQATIEELHKQVNKHEERIFEQEERIVEQEERIVEQEERNDKQQEQIKEQHTQIKAQQEQINEIRLMLINFVGRSTE